MANASLRYVLFHVEVARTMKMSTGSEGADSQDLAATRRSALFEISRSANQSVSLTELLQRIQAPVSTIFPHHELCIALWEQGVGDYSLTCVRNSGGALSISPNMAERSLLDLVRESGEPAVVEGQALDQNIAHGFADNASHSSDLWFGVPLRMEGGTILGVAFLRSTKTASPVPEFPLELLEFVANHVVLLLRRQSERESTRDWEQRFYTLLEDSLDAVVFIDQQGIVVEFNQVAQELFGRSREELLGRDMSSLWADSRDWAKYQEEMEKRGAVKGFETRIKRKLGERVECRLTSSIRRDSKGLLQGFQEIFRDITEDRRLEDQFRQAQKMEALGILASGVAHDFNNVLTGITCYSELALRKLNPAEKSSAHVERVRDLADRGARLVRQLLAFSRRQTSESVVVHLNRLIEDTLKMLRRLIGEDVDLALHTSAEPDKIRVDPGKIEQVLMNLAVNARDAMPDGGMLTIKTSNQRISAGDTQSARGARPGEYVVLDVADTGKGMSEDVRQRVFEPFFTTKDPGKGTGLGLSTIYGIVRQYKGQVFVESSPGKGARFMILLPSAAGQISVEAGEAQERPSPTGSETILLVEDDAEVRSVMERVLNEQGYRVLGTSSPLEAEMIFAENKGKIPMLLTDIVMPGCTGPELYRKLRETRPSLRVLFVSGYADKEVLRSEVLKPGLPFLQKPFQPAELGSRVRGVLDEPEP